MESVDEIVQRICDDLLKLTSRAPGMHLFLAVEQAVNQLDQFMDIEGTYQSAHAYLDKRMCEYAKNCK